MKKILAQSTAYQGLVDAFEEKRREDLFVSYPDINKIVSEVSELMDYVAS